ncbi:MAG: nuclear transport factor 2 family protein [Gemmatimonadota bacterium]
MHRPVAPIRPLILRGLTALIVLTATFAPASLHAQTDEEAIKQTLVDMWAAIEAGDLEQYATYIHEDFTSFGETETYLKDGKRLELLGVEGWTSRYADIHTEMHHPEVTVHGDTAWITYYWTDESINRSTGARETTRGKSTRIFVREDGRWLCIHGHYTLVA